MLSLGNIQIKERTFENDLELSQRYQTFSMELLRLSLLGIAAIGFLLTEIMKMTHGTREGFGLAQGGPQAFKVWISFSLLFFGLAAVCALLHRFLGTDSLAFHLRALRLELRAQGDDLLKAKEERTGRNWRFRWAGWFLLGAGLLLVVWGGAVFLAFAFVFGILCQ